MPIVRGSNGKFVGGVLGASAKNPGQRKALATFIMGGKFHGVAGGGVRQRLGNTFGALRRAKAGALRADRKEARRGGFEVHGRVVSLYGHGVRLVKGTSFGKA